jgi:hypothetical protein
VNFLARSWTGWRGKGAILARGEPPPGHPRKDDTHRRTNWPDDLPEVVYIDHFGNAMTGLRAVTLPHDAKLVAAGRVSEHARSFSEHDLSQKVSQWVGKWKHQGIDRCPPQKTFTRLPR